MPWLFNNQLVEIISISSQTVTFRYPGQALNSALTVRRNEGIWTRVVRVEGRTAKELGGEIMETSE